MRKFVLGFILLLCFSVFAQENENCGIVFSSQSVFQKMVQHDGLFSLDKFQFAGGKNAEIKTDFDASLRIIEEAKFLSEKADFCRNMSWASFVSNCVLSLFYFPLCESSYRNGAAEKYNQFGLID